MTSMSIEVDPHWMIKWPFDPETTGLPSTHKPTGSHVMWAGSAIVYYEAPIRRRISCAGCPRAECGSPVPLQLAHVIQ